MASRTHKMADKRTRGYHRKLRRKGKQQEQDWTVMDNKTEQRSMW